MSKFASLSSSTKAVRGKLQAALFHARETNREKRVKKSAPLSFAGAKVGVIGSGGALPTGWLMESASLSYEVVSLARRGNQPAITIRVFGTNSSGQIQYPAIRIRNIDPVVPGQQYRLSMLADVIAETTPFGEVVRAGIQSKLMPGDSYVAGTDGNFPADWDTLSVLHTIQATANRASFFLFNNSVANGASVNVTVQIGLIKTKRIS